VPSSAQDGAALTLNQTTLAVTRRIHLNMSVITPYAKQHDHPAFIYGIIVSLIGACFLGDIRLADIARGVIERGARLSDLPASHPLRLLAERGSP
jgi:hypothetical protein